MERREQQPVRAQQGHGLAQGQIVFRLRDGAEIDVVKDAGRTSFVEYLEQPCMVSSWPGPLTQSLKTLLVYADQNQVRLDTMLGESVPAVQKRLIERTQTADRPEQHG